MYVNAYFSDIDECQNDPCEYGGTCTDFLDGFNCTCLDGFQGERCEIRKSSSTIHLSTTLFLVAHLIDDGQIKNVPKTLVLTTEPSGTLKLIFSLNWLVLFMTLDLRKDIWCRV